MTGRLLGGTFLSAACPLRASTSAGERSREDCVFVLDSQAGSAGAERRRSSDKETMTRMVDGHTGDPVEGSVGDRHGPASDRTLQPMRVIWEWTRSLGLAIVLFLVVRIFVVEAFKIPTSSMEKTLLVGDFLLVNKAVYGSEVPLFGVRIPGWKEPVRNDVIVFNPSHDPLKNYVKRVVGVPGDTLAMRDKVLYVNGIALTEDYARHTDRTGADAIHSNMSWQRSHLLASEAGRRRGDRRGYRPSRDNWGPLSVPEGGLFVLGDNRDNSEDSRYWGFVSRDAVRGQPWLVYFSFDPASLASIPWLRAVRWGRLGERVR